jgi:hypothetical protein
MYTTASSYTQMLREEEKEPGVGGGGPHGNLHEAYVAGTPGDTWDIY